MIVARLLLSMIYPAIAAQGNFELVGPEQVATVLVPEGEPECVRLAAADLREDVRKITGKELPLVNRPGACGTMSVVLASMNQPASAALVEQLAPHIASQLRGRWEAYHVVSLATPAGKRLLIAGSDERGTMFGLYAFLERYVGVEPLYFWSSRPPRPRATLAWDRVELVAGEPTFHFRGWFVNDEDLLTEWRLDGGQRHIDYRYYHNVISPTVSARIFEAALRLGFNIIIPSSFVDLRNPAEARLIADATRRGLFVTMHHVEPMGVSGFGFANYWKDRGQDVPFSYSAHQEKFLEVWRVYAGLWAKYPNVVWQLGLRGIADRPFWTADPGAPQSDAGRGKLIADAMAAQWRIVREVDPRPQPPATTTLWMEGAALHEAGHLQFPKGVAVIFSDNSPGWELQRDFHTVRREPSRPYGIYYHHQLWGSGPHLVQGVSPQKTHQIFRMAVDRGSTHYAMLNVSNVREFALGLEASGQMLRNFRAFDPDRFLAQWCAARFPAAAKDAETAYRRLFDSFVADPATGKRAMLDGEWMQAGVTLAKSLAARLKKATPADGKAARLLAPLQAQREKVDHAGADADRIAGRLVGDDRAFFESNFMAQQKIMLGILRWVEGVAQATAALDRGDRPAAGKHLSSTKEAIVLIDAGKSLASRGEFADWYRGDRKMDLARLSQWTQTLNAAVNARRSSDGSPLP